MTTADMLERAKSVLMKDGWCQGVYSDREGKKCIVGALMATTLLAGFDPGASEEALTLLQEVVSSYSVSVWNDQRGRTLRDVLDAFDVAALVAREREALAVPEYALT